MEQAKATPTVFQTILDPLLPLLRAQCAQLKDDANTYTLSLAPFVINLLFAVLNNTNATKDLPQKVFAAAVKTPFSGHQPLRNFSCIGIEPWSRT
jgi:hypothetical protein